MLLPTTLLSLSLLAATASAAPLLPRATCYSGIYIIGARGSEEAPGFGSVQPVVTSLLAAIPNSGAVALDYPASVLDPLYPDSVTDGINAMEGLITSYVNDCGGEIVLVGFSQGANVVTDVLAGGVDKPEPISAGDAAYSTSFLHGLEL